MDFEIIIDDCLFNHVSKPPYKTKNLLSLINGFQDGKWRSDLFHNFLWDNIVETALSAKERAALSTKHSTALKTAAANLRLANPEKGGEIGEVMLYGILRHHFNALPIIPKIFYKQNTQDYAKGADSVHLVIDSAGEFQIWLGESKFYDSLTTSRLGKIVASVKDTLSSSKLRKEFNIVTSLQDLDAVCDNPTLVTAIKTKLDKGISLDDIKDILHVPILILHECEDTQKEFILSAAYKKKIMDKHLKIADSYFGNQDGQCATIFCYDKIKFHIILFPVPKKEDIVKLFVEEANSWRK